MSVADAYLRMLKEAKKEKELDAVDKKELKKDYDDRDDKDIDNDGDTDDSDEYLHKKRKAVSKAMKQDEQASCGKNKKEAIEIDPDDGEVSKKKDDSKKKSKKGEEEKVMNEESEKLEPKAKGEKDFKDDHKVDVIDRPDAEKQDGTDKVKVAPARPGDSKVGEKKFKDIRK